MTNMLKPIKKAARRVLGDKVIDRINETRENYSVSKSFDGVVLLNKIFPVVAATRGRIL